ncbi:MAG: hypothetical protein KKB77_01665 [Bacteroidetes bacterium]|nr:hypothetical protein [Bacteroidota bacterium]
MSILECPTLIRCLGYKGRPAKVSEKEIESIKIALREPEKIKIEDMPFIKGDEVVVTSGMCKGLVGSIVEIRGSLRVLVYLEEIQKAISVEVNCNEIKKLVADNKAVS